MENSHRGGTEVKRLQNSFRVTLTCLTNQITTIWKRNTQTLLEFIIQFRINTRLDEKLQIRIRITLTNSTNQIKAEWGTS